MFFPQTCGIFCGFSYKPQFLFSLQKFSHLKADDIEQMRFKQRLKVIHSLEDTAKRSVVSHIHIVKIMY